MPNEPERTFADHAAAPERGTLRELWGFLRTHKKWWLLPIIVVLVLVSGLVVLSTTSVGPFVYTLF